MGDGRWRGGGHGEGGRGVVVDTKHVEVAQRGIAL